MVKTDDYEFVEESEMSQSRLKPYDPKRPYYPYRGPINRPCSACSAGDTKMEHHDHDYVDLTERRERRQVSSSKSYTLDELRGLIKQFLSDMEASGHITIYGSKSLTDWKFETFLQWARKREREVGDVR